MTIDDIIRAWEDREYRESLSDEERALLPEDPVGQIEMTEDELTKIVGGIGPTGLGKCRFTQGGGPFCGCF